ncbi:MAG: hypothetical protein JWN98_2693 [Abditibacteriota bacterium]|nr:hypothetical protein [Abditibacteriota bacterium]
MADHDQHPTKFNGRTMIPQGTQENGVPFGHEESDANIRTTLIACVVVLSSVVVVMMAMAGMFNYLNNREKLKDKDTPALFSRRVDPPKPWLLPSPQQDQLPWVAFEDERRAQEATAAKIGIIDAKTGVYKVPGATGNSTEAQTQYFANKYQWERSSNKYTAESSGGRLMHIGPSSDSTPQANDPYPGHSMTEPPEPFRNGERIRTAPVTAMPAATSAASTAPAVADSHSVGSH